MELKNQITSLKLSKKLKELGVKQESLFWWGEYAISNQFLGKTKVCTDLHTADTVNYSEICKAFTVAELGEMLPDFVKTKGGLLQHDEKKFPDYYEVSYRIGGDPVFGFSAEVEANARAKMLIYLIEDEYVNAKSLS